MGTAASVGSPDATWWHASLALVVSVALQIGVNFANDYSDGVRGTDSDRVGPLRLVGSGAASPRAVKTAALASLGTAAAVGLVLALLTSWWLLAVGALALVSAWTYTGGPRPYGYAGLGEVFVFVFFGVVATVGTRYVTGGSTTALSFVASCAVGALACALLVVNNLRDIPGDTASGKVTLAVRLGDGRTRSLLTALFVLCAGAVCVSALLAGPEALIGLAFAPALVGPWRAVRGGATGRDLVAVLGGIGRAQLVFAASFSAGIALAL